jgi:regulatory protein
VSFTIKQHALNYLARRDHSRQELLQKLLRKHFQQPEIEMILDNLETVDLLNDRRFSDHYIQYRASAGFGPVKIEFELKQKGVSRGIIEQALEHCHIDWLANLSQLNYKKYRHLENMDPYQRQKRARFFLGRGFPPKLLSNF